jgi:hypothetical protein
MPDAKWKAMERRVAKAFGTKRNYGSGGIVQGETRADVVHDVYFIECKNRARFTHHSVFHDVKEPARKENKIPLLITHTNDRLGDLVVIRLEDFVELIG